MPTQTNTRHSFTPRNDYQGRDRKRARRSHRDERQSKRRFLAIVADAD